MIKQLIHLIKLDSLVYFLRKQKLLQAPYTKLNNRKNAKNGRKEKRNFIETHVQPLSTNGKGKRRRKQWEIKITYLGERVPFYKTSQITFIVVLCNKCRWFYKIRNSRTLYMVYMYRTLYIYILRLCQRVYALLCNIPVTSGNNQSLARSLAPRNAPNA